jgi:hypothetical protein
MTIKTDFDEWEFVYIITDPEQRRRQITGITIRNQSVSYELSFGIDHSWHYGQELSREPNGSSNIKGFKTAKE